MILSECMFGTKLNRQIVGIPMGTKCVPLRFYFAMRDIMIALPDNDQANVIEAFKSTSRYLDDRLNTCNHYFQGMVSHAVLLLNSQCFRHQRLLFEFSYVNIIYVF